MLGLWYLKESPFYLVAYSDSDYDGDNQDRKSTTGGCQFLGRRLISWQCKKQTIMATSTTEAEYVAAASGCGQVLWIQNQLLDYGYNFMNTKIYIDNNSAICIVKNTVYHSRTNHIDIRHHFIRDCYEKKLINVDHVHTDDNVADLLTKPFDVGRFQYLVVEHVMKRSLRCIKSGFTSNVLIIVSQYILGWVKEPLGTGMVALLEKTEHNTDFHQIVDFLEASHIRQRTIFESSIRRHLKLNDEEGINTLYEDEIFENLSLMGYNILPNQKFSFQKGQFSHQWKFLIHTIMQCISPKSTADEPASPPRDDSHGEAFPTATSLDARQDRENIDKTSAMPYEPSPRVTSLDGGEGREDFSRGDAEKDSSKSAEKGSDGSGVMANVLGTLEAVNILASGGLKSVFTTASPSVTPASLPVAPVSATVSPAVATASKKDASITTPYTRRTRASKGIIIEPSHPTPTTSIPTFSTKGKGKEKMVESTGTKKRKTQEQLDAQVARELEEEFAQED
ncbi:hypothetical protein Tco_0601715 [Tanacetum coccineum]